MFRNHVCIVFPLHHISLYDFLYEAKFEGLQLVVIKKIMTELLEGVHKIHSMNIVHCDLKP
jgi:serine/threonine protein kinase